METIEEEAAPPAPGWTWFLAGWLLAAAELERVRPDPTEAEVRARMPAGAAGELDSNPDTMSVRALRRLPAIGQARALAIARERWERGLAGGPESWIAIRGIGPETVAAIRRALSSTPKPVDP